VHAPTITATYLAVLALIYTALSIRVLGMALTLFVLVTSALMLLQRLALS
jgi:hypothetical protein